jgi:hypothetical protein
MSATLGYSQVDALTPSLLLDIRKELIENHPDFNKYELNAFLTQVVNIRLRAILVTLTEASYEDIVKVVHDKLNLNDLFDNKQKYLN